VAGFVKNVVIVGPGGIGGTFAALLTRSRECHVTVLGRPGAHADAMRERGLRLEGLDSFVVPVEVIDDAARIENCDVMIYAVKAQDSGDTLAATAHIEVRDFATSIQNGVVKDDLLVRTFGRSKVIGALAVVAGERSAPGVIRWTYDGATRFGELDGHRSDRVDWLVERCARAGLRTEASTEISSATWTKLVGWSPIGLLATLSRQTNAEILSNELLATAYIGMVHELAELAGANEVPLLDLGPFEVQTWLAATAADAIQRVMTSPLARGQSTHSALQDVQRGEMTEFEAILGPLLADASTRKIPMTRTRTLYAALMGLERSLS
jgi:2-dehydropantoate 2-reductase